MVSLREGLMLEGGGVVSLVGGGGKTSLMFKLARELSMAGDTVLTTTTTKIFEPTRDQTSCVILSDSAKSILEQADGLLNKHLHLTAAVGKIPESGKLCGFRPEIIGELWHAGLFQWIIVEADGAAGKPLKVPVAHEPVIPGCTKRLVGMVGLNGVGKPLTERLVFRHEHFARLTGLKFGSTVTDSAIADVLVHDDGLFKGFCPEVMRIAFFNQADVKDNFSAGQRIARILSKRKNTGLNRVVIGQILFEPPVLEVYDLEPFF
ncbi:MAG: selenium cofactor biosynthesis protein YqeC [Desulfobacterales bacterium]|nr:selenium cofactor biosynthesis protein YqeC [Desulfobacterales bacterium]